MSRGRGNPGEHRSATRPEPVGPSDAALVVAARAGEKWAQEALFRRHARMVNGLAYRLLGADHELDDLVQESFLAALRSLDRLAQPQAFAAWLGSIVVRHAHKLLRKRKLLSRLGLRRNAPIELDAVAANVTEPSVRTELRAVYGCLQQLDPQARVALVLHRVDGLSIPQVAEQMALSVSTVKRRLKVAEGALASVAGEPEGAR